MRLRSAQQKKKKASRAEIYRATSLWIAKNQRKKQLSSPPTPSASTPAVTNYDDPFDPLPKLQVEEWLTRQTVFVPSDKRHQQFSIQELLLSAARNRKKNSGWWRRKSLSSSSSSVERNSYPSSFSEENDDSLASLCKREMSLCVARDIQSSLAVTNQVVVLDHGWNTTKTILQEVEDEDGRLHLLVVEATDREYERMRTTKREEWTNVQLRKGYLQSTECLETQQMDYLFADFCGGPAQLIDLIKWLYFLGDDAEEEGRQPMQNRMKPTGRLVVTLCSRGVKTRHFLELVLSLPAPFPGAKLTNFIRYKTNMFVFLFDNPELVDRSKTYNDWEKLVNIHLI